MKLKRYKDSNLYSTNSHFFFHRLHHLKKGGYTQPSLVYKKQLKKEKKKRKQVEIIEMDTIMMQKQIAATQSASYEIILNP